MVLTIIAIVLTLLLVIGIHEAGHALAARLVNVKIKKISLGFGRPLILWKSKSGCEWQLGMWPLGGYVQLLNTRISPVDEKEYLYCFDKKPIGQRIFILSAGVLANFLIAWLAFVFVAYHGIYYRIPQVQNIQANSLAAHAGIVRGDQIVAIAQRATPSWQAVGMELIILWGKKDVKLMLKEGKEVTLDLSTVQFTGKERSLLERIGIKPNVSASREVHPSASIFAAVGEANNTIGHWFYFFIILLKQLLTGVIPFAVLLGPIGLFAVSIASLMQGVIVFMYFIAAFSLAVAFINILPLPGLDGASILYCLIEKIRGKPLSVAMEVLLYQLMFILSCVLLVHLILNDLARILV